MTAPPPTVAIVGGGFTGAAVAFHLARALAKGEARIVVVEPREALGAGLAYSTRDAAHRINVPAARMSLDSAEPEQFARWLAASGLGLGDAAATTATNEVFPQRGLFGRYVAAMLAPLVADGRIGHARARAEAVLRRGDARFEIALGDASALTAEIVVLATTHPLPAVPPALRAIETSPRFLADPYDAERLAAVDRNAAVLVVGNGLTAADIVAGLDGRGHAGPIVTLSRNGLRSRGHAPVPVEPFGDFLSDPAATALHLLRHIRRTLARAAAEGIGWHGVLDAVRAQGRGIWQALPDAERRRLVHRLRAFWDVHRFRVAPQVEAVLDRLTADGRLRTVAASLRAATQTADGIDVAFRRRGSTRVEVERFDVVVNTTGPAHRGTVRTPGPLRSLFEQDLVALDRVGLGIATSREGRAVAGNGLPVDRLYVAGPLARGTVGELMGLLEVTRHAEFVAAEIVRDLRRPAAVPARPRPNAASEPAAS